MTVSEDQLFRWHRAVKVRDLINKVLGELTTDAGAMSRDSERSMMWLAAEVSGVASDAVSAENRQKLRALYDEMNDDFAAAGDLIPTLSRRDEGSR